MYRTTEPDSLGEDFSLESLEDETGKLPSLAIPSEDIFKGNQVIWIEHDGARYCLRITRKNKLILHK